MTTYAKWIIAITAGALIGFGYWYFIGCTSGSCAITASPVNSSLYGGLMGGLLLNLFSGEKKLKMTTLEKIKVIKITSFNNF